MPMTPNAPRARRLTGAMSLLIALSSVALLIGAVTTSPPSWLLILFEVTILFGCAFGVAFGLGRFPAAPQMTMLCLAGTVLACTLLGPVSVQLSVHGVSLLPVIIGRALLAFVLIAGAAAVTLGDNRAAWRRAIRGAGLLVLFVLGSFGGWWVLVKSGFSGSVHGIVVLTFSIVLYLVLTGLLAGAAHLIITGFANALEHRGARRNGGNGDPGSPTTGHEPA